MNKLLIAIVGPTASGKSALAMQVAQKYGGEIIAADSRTIYRGMDIGTAKPTVRDQQRVQHHLLDIRDPDQAFSAAEFKTLATQAIDEIHGRGRLPILVGGTGLYVDAVLFDYQFGEAADPTYRKYLNALTVEELQSTCREKNIVIPINSQNKRHLVRAVELGGLHSVKRQLGPNTLVVGITTEREKLRRRIQKRAQEMIAEGVLDEVRTIGSAYGWQSEALKGNIYRVFRPVVEGRKLIDEATADFVVSDIALAKRQMTWLRRNPYIRWSEDPNDLLLAIEAFVDSRSELSVPNGETLLQS